MNSAAGVSTFINPDCGELIATDRQQSLTFDDTQAKHSKKNKLCNYILYCLEKYQFTVLANEIDIDNTELPEYLFELGWHSKGLIAIVSRSHERAFTIETEELHSRAIGPSTISNNEATIQCLNEDILLREILADPILTKYGLIIVKEVERRHILTDTIIALLKKISKKRSSLKVILCSNAYEAQFLADFLNTKQKHDKVASVVLSTDKPNSTIKTFYLKKPCADYVTKTIEIICKLHKEESMSGDVVAYLADEDELADAMNLMKAFITDENIKNLNYFKWTDNRPDGQKVFFPKSAGIRNVIFTTNLYQQSVSTHRIGYIIDCGFVQVNYYESENYKYNKMVVPICKAIAFQRANWVGIGRNRSVKVFRLYTKNDYTTLPDRAPSEMRRADLCSLVLYLKTLAIENVLRFDFPSAPPAKNLLAALETLYALEAIDEEGHLKHPLGYFMVDVPFSPMLSRMLHSSIGEGCSDEVLSIVSMLQVEHVFSISNNVSDNRQVAKRSFEAAEGDLLTLLNVYSSFVENDKSKDFCRKYFLSYNNLMRVCVLRKQYATHLKEKYGITLVSCKGDSEKICKCITSGFFLNVAYLHHSGVYRSLRSGTELFIHRDSSIYTLQQPKYIIYCDLIEKNKVFMKNLTVIKEEWLSELAPHFYEKRIF